MQAHSSPGGLQPALQQFSASLKQEDLPGKVAKSVKELHSGVAKLGKVGSLSQRVFHLMHMKRPSNIGGAARGTSEEDACWALPG